MRSKTLTAGIEVGPHPSPAELAECHRVVALPFEEVPA